jgi:ribonuclease HI
VQHASAGSLLEHVRQVALPSFSCLTEEPRFLYVDGTSRPSSCKGFSLAAASVFEPMTGWVLSFPIPGYVQTSDRAEIYALYAAMCSSRNATIYTDCKYVHIGFQALCKSPVLASLHDSHRDLWYGILTLLVARAPRSFTVVKVKAHSWESTCLQQRTWHSYGNHIADVTAKLGNMNRSVQVLKDWKDNCTFADSCISLLRSALIHMVASYRAYECACKHRTAHATPPVENVLSSEANAQVDSHSILPRTTVSTPRGTAHFQKVKMPDVQALFPYFLLGTVFGCKLLSYLAMLEWPTSEAAKRVSTHVTTGDLCLDFIYSSGIHPPTKVVTGARRCDVTYIVPHGKEDSQNFSALLKCFAESLHMLSIITKHELIPGLQDTSKQCFVELATGHRCFQRSFPHAPLKLLCQRQVEEFKTLLRQDVVQAGIFKSDNFFIHSQHTCIIDSFSPQSLPEYDHPAWWNERNAREQRARYIGERRLGFAQISKAVFVDHG